MRRFGLIGFPLTHSFSKKYFTQKFTEKGIDAIYETYPIKDIAELGMLIKNNTELEGINVTIPHKQSVIPFLHSMSDVVNEIRACNCIRIRNNKLEGFNTDVTGFDISLITYLKRFNKKALVLGTGGDEKAVCFVLSQKGIPWLQVSRNPTGNIVGYSDITATVISETRLIINTTPLGMFPDTDHCPELPYDAITDQHYLFDLVYNPSLTLFLQKGQQQGAVIENGYKMLVIQAEESWKIWNS